MQTFYIDNTQTFNITDILESGQAFRYFQIEENKYVIISGCEICYVEQSKNNVKFTTSNKEYFFNYFDLKTDYNHIIDCIKDKPFMKESLNFSSGVRILKQDKFETIITFIISANNNIKRIKYLVNTMCEKVADKKDGYPLFATVDQLVKKDLNFYKELGCGYRATYLYATVNDIYNKKIDIETLGDLPTEKAREQLMQLKGVGPKVADCILLFAYGKEDVFPVDTWVKKIYQDIFNQTDSQKQISDKLVKLYSPYAGYAQQYLFYAKRNAQF